MTFDAPTIEFAGRVVLQWAIWHARMVEIALRPWALIDGETADVVFHAPEGLR